MFYNFTQIHFGHSVLSSNSLYIYIFFFSYLLTLPRSLSLSTSQPSSFLINTQKESEWVSELSECWVSSDCGVAWSCVIDDDGDGDGIHVVDPCGCSHWWCSFSPQEVKLVALWIQIRCEAVLSTPWWHGLAPHWQHVVLPQSFQVQGPWFLHLLLCFQVITIYQ